MYAHVWSMVEIDWTRQEREELASLHLPGQPKTRACHIPHGVGRAQEYQKMTNWYVTKGSANEVLIAQKG